MVTASAAAASAVVEVRTARNPTARPPLREQLAERRGGEQLAGLGGGPRPGEVKALGVVAAELAQAVGLLGGFHALADRLDLERLGQRDDGRDDRLVLPVSPEAGDERPVDLDLVGSGELADLAEGRKTDAKIVDGQANAEPLEGAQRRLSPLRVLGD